MDKPKLKLTDEDGNAIVILARARKTARRAGWTSEKIEEFTNKAKSRDYDHLLQTVMIYFDVE